MNVLAIDPGNAESAYALIDGRTCRPWQIGKVPNDELRTALTGGPEFGSALVNADVVAVEMVASYGMAVGAEVFETCVWVGRFAETAERRGRPAELVKRLPVKLHHCHDSKAKDTNIRQALVDRFAPGQPNHGKGTKMNPGWFYGFRADVWQAMALAVYAADKIAAGEPL